MTFPIYPSVQFSSVTQSCPTLCNPMTVATQASLSITKSGSMLKLMSIESVMPSNHLIFCCPLLLLNFSFSQFSSVQSLSRVWLFVTPWITARQASLSITNSRSLLKLMLIESVMPCNHLILCHPLFALPSIFQHQSLSRWIGSSHQVAKVLEFQLQHQSFQWIFRIDFL